jgi:predicted DNA-binding transcriptional regulator YafY
MPRRKKTDNVLKTGARILYLMKYLFENTDENNKKSSTAIVDYFSANHHVDIDRKTIYSDIETLQDFGVKVKHYRNVKYPTKQGYYITERDFTIDDLRLIADCVQSSKFITQVKADDLTKRLKKLARESDSSTLDRRNYVENRIRSDNENIFNNNQIGNIHTAIARKKKISFQYLKYNLKLERVPSTARNNGYYKVSPYMLVWSDNQYYLIGFVGKRRINFRVDRMNDITILEENRDAEKEYEALNLENYASKSFSMFTGTIQRVQIKFRNELLNVAIDRFGLEVRITPEGQEHFIAYVEVETSPQFYGWLCGLGKAVELISPPSTVKKMGEYVADIAKMYEISE